MRFLDRLDIHFVEEATFYVWLSGFVDIAAGLVKVLTFGFIGTGWGWRYAVWRARNEGSVPVLGKK